MVGRSIEMNWKFQTLEIIVGLDSHVPDFLKTN